MGWLKCAAHPATSRTAYGHARCFTLNNEAKNQCQYDRKTPQAKNESKQQSEIRNDPQNVRRVAHLFEAEVMLPYSAWPQYLALQQ